MRRTILTAIVALTFLVSSANQQNKVENKIETEAVAVTTTVKKVGLSTFCKAIVKGDLETVKSLIALGENVNQKSLGKTPAIFAARYNKTEILKVLIKNGANLRIKCDKGISAKRHAELSNAKESLAVIVAALKK